MSCERALKNLPAGRQECELRVICYLWNAFELFFFLITPFGRELKVLLFTFLIPACQSTCTAGRKEKSKSPSGLRTNKLIVK
jgi:hypothetical protein